MKDSEVVTVLCSDNVSLTCAASGVDVQVIINKNGLKIGERYFSILNSLNETLDQAVTRWTSDIKKDPERDHAKITATNFKSLVNVISIS